MSIRGTRQAHKIKSKSKTKFFEKHQDQKVVREHALIFAKHEQPCVQARANEKANEKAKEKM
jgi:hypothetical protein